MPKSFQMSTVDYMTKPSHQFFTHQAVLNTLLDWYPACTKKYGASFTAKNMLPDIAHPCTPYGMSFVQDVREEYRKLESQYT